MFDRQTVSLLEQLPEIEGFDGTVARTRLTQAYLELVRTRAAAIEQDESLANTVERLRQMGNGLELYCIIEFAREGRLLDSGRAAAFIAAQSLELLAEFLDSGRDTRDVGNLRHFRHVLADPRRLSRVEAGLLYLIAGYYANAAIMGRNVALGEAIQGIADYDQLRQNIAGHVLQLLVGLLQLRLIVRNEQAPVWPSELENDFPRAPSDLSASIEARLLLKIAHATRLYLQFLAGEEASKAQAATALVVSVRKQVADALSTESRFLAPAEALLPHHLACLLEIVFRDLEAFATTHEIKPPPDSDSEYQSTFQNWVRAKASRGYALLWHSTREWLDARRKGAVHTVVSMPTGSGKSFLGELALADRLHQGWGLYLAPMNALVRQIRYDLVEQLRELGVEVRRFLTDEHTTLAREILGDASPREIIVMTPEKASLAIRLNPEVFEKCSVCIFDECHLIAKEDRGAISEDFMYRLLSRSPDVHIVLMSAMLQTPEKLAEWLYKATGKTSAPVLLNWKPTRSLRTLATIPEGSLRNATGVKMPTKCEVQLLGQANIAWQTDQDKLFVRTLLPPIVTVAANQTQEGRVTYGWDKSVNDAARKIAVSLAQRHISTVLFLNSQATHVWTHADQVHIGNWFEPQGGESKKASYQVEAWLSLADTELGNSSPLRNYHRKAVTVHSGALIDEERNAAEIAYRNGLVGLMVATGSLAQGLNFPTQAVVMAGIEANREFLGERTPADILNALGRSGRAGFHNVGLSILVPRNVLSYSSRISDLVERAPKYFDLLRQEDACLDPDSALKQQLDSMIETSKLVDVKQSITAKDLATATLILEQAGRDYERPMFRRSYAAYLSPEPTTYVADVMTAASKLINFYVSRTKCPEWLPELAQKAGLSVGLLNDLRYSIEKSIPLEMFRTPSFSFEQAITVLTNLMQDVHPAVLGEQFGIQQLGTGTLIFKGLPAEIGGRKFDWTTETYRENKPAWEAQWRIVFELVRRWMRGESFAKIAVGVLAPESLETQEGTPLQFEMPLPQLSRSSRGPLHKAIKSIRDLSYPLRHVSSGLVILITKLLKDNHLIEEDSDLPLSFGMLSQAIHWGVDRMDKAFWYYYLLPVRCVAHSMAAISPVGYENDNQVELEIRNRAEAIRKTGVMDLSERQVSEEISKVLHSALTLFR